MRKWRVVDKWFVGVYLVGELLDVITTIYGMHLGFPESNPFIKSPTDMLISAVITTSIIVGSAWYFRRFRIPILVVCNTIKWYFVLNNILLIW